MEHGMRNTDEKWLRIAACEGRIGARKGEGGPFGACVVKNGVLIGRAHSEVIKRSNPCAHAEINAIRLACRKLKTVDLSGATLYTSCEPCPMCMGAALWARLSRVVYGVSIEKATEIGFDHSLFYDYFKDRSIVRWLEVKEVKSKGCTDLMNAWLLNPRRQHY
jgi:guanine deaminase